METKILQESNNSPYPEAREYRPQPHELYI